MKPDRVDPKKRAMYARKYYQQRIEKLREQGIYSPHEQARAAKASFIYPNPE